MQSFVYFLTLTYLAYSHGAEETLRHCMDAPDHAFGPFTIKLPDSDIKPFEAMCFNIGTRSLMLISNVRPSGKDDFNRTWEDYKNGFGSTHIIKAYFIGLEKLHAITSTGKHKLVVALRDNERRSNQTIYSDFKIGSEEEGYALKSLGETERVGRTDLLRPHLGMKFSTPDRDNDDVDSKHCAKVFESGWWFKGEECAHCDIYAESVFGGAVFIPCHNEKNKLIIAGNMFLEHVNPKS